MKRILLAMAMCTVALNAFGQGTVNFSNLSTALSSPPDRLIRFGDSGGVAGVPPAGSPASTNLFPGLVAQLFYGASTASAASLIAVSTAPGTLRSSTSASAGTWFNNGTRTLTGFNPGDTVNLQVRVWDISFGTDYNQVIARFNTDCAFQLAYVRGIGNGNWLGTSSLFQYTIPTNPTPAPSELNMNNFVGFSLFYPLGDSPCPEPASPALLALGVAGLLMIRRREQFSSSQ